MPEAASGLRWGTERRLEFIEFRLFWDGRVNRSDLVGAFGISVNQASADLNRYLALAPENMAYDHRARTYVRAEAIVPLFLKPDAGRYLAQIRSVADGLLDESASWIGSFPAYDATPTPARGINPEILRAVISAIHRQHAIEIEYQSLSRPLPTRRQIAPHAIGFDGFRWHARAFCELDQTFKDFVLSRMLHVTDAGPSGRDPTSDADWNSHVVLEIGPHPELSETQKRVIALDYGMCEGRTRVRVRKAFLYYTLKRLGLDTDPAARRPQDQQIVLIEAREDHA